MPATFWILVLLGQGAGSGSTTIPHQFTSLQACENAYAKTTEAGSFGIKPLSLSKLASGWCIEISD